MKEGLMVARFVPFYRLGKHLQFPMLSRNPHAAKFKRFLTYVHHGKRSDSRSILADLIHEWLGNGQRLEYTPKAFSNFWLFDPSAHAFTITRARCFPSGQRTPKNEEWKLAARMALRSPASKLSAPPPELTQLGRCNFKRKPVFYGSFQDFTCMAELRPMVGSCLVLAQFAITKPLKIFRLHAYLERIDIPHEYSQDDDLRNIAKGTPDYDRASFQYHLDLWMGVPLLVPYSHPEYSARRLVAHALREMIISDGIEFTSSQINGSNLVIFPTP
jgi:hypothetical protein